MYKIYINETPIIISSDKQDWEGYIPEDNFLISKCPNKKKMMLNYVDMLEKTNRWDGILWKTKDEDASFSLFSSLYKAIRAGGGIVQNKSGEILLIFRFGKWDLPKGKQEKGEKIRLTASREIKEETGLTEIAELGFIDKSYHTYRTKKGNRVLKETHWYHYSTKEQNIKPQIEEGIEKVEWILPSNLGQYMTNTYPNINELMIKFLSDGSK